MKQISWEKILYLAPLLLLVIFSYLWRNYQLDDALIYLRYIKNFQGDFGLVYNPGDKFNGLTSPLFSYLMVLLSFATQQLLLLSLIFSAIFLFLASLIGAQLFAKTGLGKIFSACAILSFAYFYSTFGMESSLFLFLIAWSLYLYKNNSPFLLIPLALLLITRIEGIFLIIPILISCCASNKKVFTPSYISLGLLIVLFPFLFNKIYYGDFLAHTGSAKIGQGKSGYWGYGWIFFHINYFIKAFFSGSHVAVFSFSLTSIIGAFLLLKDKAALIAIIFFFSLLAFYGFLNIPNYHWYYAPFFFFCVLFSSFAIEWVCLKIQLLQFGILKVICYLVLASSVGWFFLQTAPFTGGGRNESYAQIGTWINLNTAKTSSLASVEVGTIGWYSDRFIIDILGLTNKFNATFIGNKDVYSWLTKYQPDYILLHNPPWIHEEGASALQKNKAYEVVEEFNFPGYILLKKANNISDIEIIDLATKLKK